MLVKGTRPVRYWALFSIYGVTKYSFGFSGTFHWLKVEQNGCHFFQTRFSSVTTNIVFEHLVICQHRFTRGRSFVSLSRTYLYGLLTRWRKSVGLTSFPRIRSRVSVVFENLFTSGYILQSLLSIGLGCTLFTYLVAGNSLPLRCTRHVTWLHWQGWHHNN